MNESARDGHDTDALFRVRVEHARLSAAGRGTLRGTVGNDQDEQQDRNG